VAPDRDTLVQMKGPGTFDHPAATDCDTFPVDRVRSAEFVLCHLIKPNRL